MRGETQGCRDGKHPDPFQSTPLMRGETDTKTCSQVTSRDFNPFPSCEGRRRSRCFPARRPQFQSAPLMRGETTAIDRLRAFEPFQSTPLIRGKTLQDVREQHAQRISIHSPHARGDAVFDAIVALIGISIHSPLARGDLRDAQSLVGDIISIRSPHTKGDRLPCAVIDAVLISIHSPHARGDAESGCGASGHDISIRSPLTRGDICTML